MRQAIISLPACGKGQWREDSLAAQTNTDYVKFPPDPSRVREVLS